MKPGALHVILVDIAASAAALAAEEKETPRLSPADVARFSKDADRQSARRTAHIALRIALERAAGAQLRQLNFSIAEGGRPFLAGAPHFSISHSDGRALIAIADQPIGVDIERIRYLRMSENRRERIIAVAMRLDREPPCEMPVLEAWVRLEAVAKARGTGIGVLLTEEGVVGGRTRRSALLSESFDVRTIPVGESCVAAIAGGALPRAIDVEIMPADVPGLASFLRLPSASPSSAK